MNIFVSKYSTALFMKSLVTVILALTCFVACSTSTDKKNNKTGQPAENPSPWMVLQETEADSFITLRFEPFTAIINRFYTDDSIPAYIIREDSVFLWAVYGGTIEGETVFINGHEQLEGLKVEQCFVTSIYISDEGECCELRDWKHYISPWKPLQPLKPGLFRCILYTLKEHERFPPVTPNELKSAVTRFCGKGWVELLEKIKKPTDEPAAVGISNFFIRISGKKAGQPFMKIIEIGSPLGA